MGLLSTFSFFQNAQRLRLDHCDERTRIRLHIEPGPVLADREPGEARAIVCVRHDRVVAHLGDLPRPEVRDEDGLSRRAPSRCRAERLRPELVSITLRSGKSCATPASPAKAAVGRESTPSRSTAVRDMRSPTHGRAEGSEALARGGEVPQGNKPRLIQCRRAAICDGLLIRNRVTVSAPVGVTPTISPTVELNAKMNAASSRRGLNRRTVDPPASSSTKSLLWTLQALHSELRGSSHHRIHPSTRERCAPLRRGG